MARGDLDVGGGGALDWGADDGYNDDKDLPPREEFVDGNGVKHVVEWSINEDAYAVKTTTLTRTTKKTRKVSRGVAARKSWAKFGECAGKPPGREYGISAISLEEINMEWVTPAGDSEEENSDDERAKADMDIQKRLKMERFKIKQEERRRGVNNWAQLMSLEAAARSGEAGPSLGGEGDGAGGSGGAGGKYVPPSKRGGGAGADSVGESMYQRDDSATVRVSNVSPSTTEADLEELFSNFGPIRRTYLSRDRVTGESRGFAFMAFREIADAARCIEKLDGYGYDHLILRVEWAQPKEGAPGAGIRPAGAHVVGRT
ncbi:hypothetical protein MMPV_001973 [Pyropia vietnamensis]